jgi:orotidine-5'-phosphate decarboxylase
MMTSDDAALCPPAGSDPARALPGPPRLVAALDLPTADEALALVGRLEGLPLWLKVGMELFAAAGPDLVRRLAGGAFGLFLDLKFHDIPNTVRRSVERAAALGARMTTLHVSGGEAMCRAAAEGREQAGRTRRSGTDAPGADLLLMGVTVLTSESGREEAVRARVVESALAAREWGLDGVVCSGREAAAVKAACGRDFLCLCPGIRFARTPQRDDQARTCTPYEAALAGADFLVMGRPILMARHPEDAAREALDGMEQAFRERQHSSQADLV